MLNNCLLPKEVRVLSPFHGPCGRRGDGDHRATLRVPGVQEPPTKCWVCWANKRTSSAAWHAQQSGRVCHQANSVVLRMASIPEGTKLFKTNLKNRLDSPSTQAKITPPDAPFHDSTGGHVRHLLLQYSQGQFVTML